MTTIEVQPRDTPAERANSPVEVQVEEPLGVHATIIEDWVEPRQAWTFTLREGHEFGKANNVEVEILFAQGEQTSLLRFRLDQLSGADDTGEQLVLRFEEEDGISKLARLTSFGMDVELFHILTFT
jgi:hypothetical protein